MNLNIEVSITEETNRALEIIRAIRGMTKKAIITEALAHYAKCVGEETTNVIRRQQTSLGGPPRGAQAAPRGTEGSPGPTEGNISN